MYMRRERKSKKVEKSFRTALNPLKNLTALLLLIGIAMVGCKKEELLSDSSNVKKVKYHKTQNNMLQFDSFEALDSMLREVLPLDYSELVSYENLHGYSSLGRINDDLYYSLIEEDQLQTCEDIENAILDYPEQLQLAVEGTDTIFITKFYQNPYRYVANENGFFQVADTVYFVSEYDVEPANIDGMIRYGGNKDTLNPQRPGYNGYYLTAGINTSNTERVRILVKRNDILQGFSTNFYLIATDVTVQGFRKIGRWWCAAKRRLNYNFTIQINYYDLENGIYIPMTSTKVYSGNLKRYKFEYLFGAQQYQPDNISLNNLYYIQSVSGSISIPAVSINF